MNAQNKIILPPTNTIRWTPSKKATVVRSIKLGHYEIKEILEIYVDLSQEELRSWISLYETYGVSSLSTTRLKQYRNNNA